MTGQQSEFLTTTKGNGRKLFSLDDRFNSVPLDNTDDVRVSVPLHIIAYMSLDSFATSFSALTEGDFKLHSDVFTQSSLCCTSVGVL